MKSRFAPAALLGVAALWGSTFFMMKEAIKREDVTSFLFTRFTIALIVMVLIRPKVFARLSRELIGKGAIAGACLAAGFLLQTLGLARTTAAITGFVTGLYVVLTPLIAYFFLKQKLALRTWFYIALAAIGLALISLRGWSLGVGELFVLAGALAFGAQIIVLSKWSRGRDPYVLTVIQLATCSLITGAASLALGYQAPPDSGVWEVAIFTAIFATALAFLIQTWAQGHMPSTQVAVILVMEIVFAAFFAVAFGDEHLTARVSAGGALIVTAMYLIVTHEP